MKQFLIKILQKRISDYFYNSFKDIYCKAFVISKTKDNQCKKRDPFFKPYITSGIAKSCRVKNKLHNRWIRARGTQYEQSVMQAYKSYRATLKSIIFKSKFSH